ncbi:LacI family DNA-binding transcriptional regulator [Limimaricola pyoseonensis]|uniref:Transcriptional regulator, LacI family n=1 Tax=Limimaricola pyoseonensis TaxID=521013 RepID=A0A1G7FSC7_9RHOB|nr:substrate-binding domain-containing protein [Limimaricola pyoseonensis]SDE78679.1 transcriptional regulator, LacI family [Limimaricola pyoseonensis]
MVQSSDIAGPRGAMAGRVTITRLSEALGLSKGTVSRALNGYPDIAEATRLRVRRQAEAMGYRPLSHAQAIKTGRVRALGLVLQIGDHDSQRPFLADFLAGITMAASAEGWTLTVATAESEAGILQTMAQLIEDRKADGFILPRTLSEDPRVTLLRERGVPFVMFGRTARPEGCAWFDILGEEAMRDAVLHLAGLGHRRIGFVNGGTRYNFSRLRLEGYRAGLAAAGLAADPDLIRGEALQVEDGARETRALLALGAPPTAVVFAVDQAALGLYRACAERGLAVGRDVSVLGYDGVPDGLHAAPPLSSFAVDRRAAGQRLAELLIRRIRGEDPELLRETARAVLVDRGSAGPPRLSSEALAARLAED